jgi:acetyl-CoA acetyltransferase
MARYYMERHGVGTDALAHVAVKNHLHGSMNPKAHFQKRITVEDYYKSRIVADPLRVMDYTPISDGAAAIVLMNLDQALSYTSKPVLVTGVSGVTDTHVVHEREDLLSIDAVKKSTERALAMAGRSLGEVGLVELHDMATILEIVQLESMGFYRRGEGWRAAVEGETRYDGQLPVNTSGGLKSKGHPIGATGVAQAYEVVLQMRGLAGERQVRRPPDVAISMSMGGFGNNAYTIVYEPGW